MWLNIYDSWDIAIPVGDLAYVFEDSKFVLVNPSQPDSILK